MAIWVGCNSNHWRTQTNPALLPTVMQQCLHSFCYIWLLEVSSLPHKPHKVNTAAIVVHLKSVPAQLLMHIHIDLWWRSVWGRGGADSACSAAADPIHSGAWSVLLPAPITTRFQWPHSPFLPPHSVHPFAVSCQHSPCQLASSCMCLVFIGAGGWPVVVVTSHVHCNIIYNCHKGGYAGRLCVPPAYSFDWAVCPNNNGHTDNNVVVTGTFGNFYEQWKLL